MKEKIPEKAELTGEVEKILCDNCFENYLFELQDSDHTFFIGLRDILECLKFAEEQGGVPKLSPEWWLQVKFHYQME